MNKRITLPILTFLLTSQLVFFSCPAVGSSGGLGDSSFLLLFVEHLILPRSVLVLESEQIEESSLGGRGDFLFLWESTFSHPLSLFQNLLTAGLSVVVVN